MTVPVHPANLLVIVMTSFCVLVIGVEVMRRSPRLGAARLLFMGSLLFQLWSVLEVVLQMNADDPVRRIGVGLAIPPLLTFLACLLLHLTFLFPLHLGLKRWFVPLLYIPFIATILFRAWIILTSLGGSTLPGWTSAALGIEPTVVNFIPIGFAVLNLARAHRATTSVLIRGRIRAVAFGTAASLALGTWLAALTLLVVGREIPSTITALPVMFTLAYSILRYQLFDIQLLKREVTIVGVGAVIIGSCVAPVIYLMVTVSSPDSLQLALMFGTFTFFLFAAGSRIRALAAGIVERALPRLKWKECQLRSLFLVHQSGTLVAEQQFSSVNAPDRQGFVGEMLVVVQALARETLGMEGGDTIRSFTIGSRKLMVEHLGEMFLMAEFDGFEHPEIRGEVGRVLKQIVERMESLGIKWDGDLEKFSWVHQVLGEIALGRGAGISGA